MKDIFGNTVRSGTDKTTETEIMESKFGKCVIVSDFDGTITTLDTNVAVIKEFGNEINVDIRERCNSGRIGIKEAVPMHYKQLHILEEDYYNFIASVMEMDQGFKSFQQKILLAGVPLVIVSGGNRNAIESIFAEHDLELPRIYANTIEFHGQEIKVKFFHEDIACDKSYGPCGNCKIKHIQNLKREYDTIIFIGDGLTDRCAAETADFVFAKNQLAEFCRENGIPYTTYRDFNDISSAIFSE